VGNAAEGDPLATVGGPSPTLRRKLEMKMYPDVDFNILIPEITRKQSKNVRKSKKTITY